MTQTSLNLPEAFLVEAKAYADRTGRKFNGLVQIALKEYMEAHK